MTNTYTVWDKLTFQEEGIEYLKPCIDLVFYWTGSVFDRVEGIVDFYQKSINQIKSDVTFYRTESMSSARRIKKDTFSLVPFWLQKTKTRREIYMLNLESGTVADVPSDRAFYLEAIELEERPLGFMRLILPVSTVNASVDSFLDFARNLASKVNYAFGQSGYSVNWNDLGDYNMEAMEAMLSIAKRYPGIDLSYPSTTCYAIQNGIKCINWLTFLSLEHCKQLGGIARLTKDLGKDIDIHHLPNGVMIQAGPAPQVGDVNRRQTLPLYHHVGRILAPIRAKDHPAFFGRNGVPSEEATENWLSRFDT